MIFFTADLHFGHKNIMLHANRPFSSIKEHDEYLIYAWNKVVTKKDLTFVLGDFAWKNHNHYIHALNGRKILIVGSHDRMNNEARKNFTEVHEGVLVRTIENMPFVLSHCAFRTFERSHYGAINLHGHSHGRLEEYNDCRQMDVGVDVHPNYAPFSIDFIKWKMSFKKDRVIIQQELDYIAKYNKDNNKDLLNIYKELNKNA